VSLTNKKTIIALILKQRVFLRGEEISLNCGGGPAALLLAAFLDPQLNVSIYEKNKTLGRKFLVAGKGGLTHSEPIAQLIERYTFPFYTGSPT
jgi:hypothetical protein